QRYRDKLSGPLLDRIDLQICLPAPDNNWLELPAGESSAEVRARVLACRRLQLQRQGILNARLSQEGMRSVCQLSGEARQLLKQAMERWDWSGRVVHRVTRGARTIADCSGRADIDVSDMAEAIQYRQPW